MKKLLSNYHTHTRLCGHALGMAEDYVAKAIECGYKEIGMSDHGPIPRSWMTTEEYDALWLSRQMTFEMYKNEYLPDLAKTVAQFGSQIRIWKGLEIEYLEGYDEYYQSLIKDLDYLNLGMHYFKYHGRYYNCYEPLDEDLVLQYAAFASRAMDTGMFKIFVHPDLYMFNYNMTKDPYVFDDACKQAAKIIIEAAIRNHVYLEVNAGGVLKGKNPECRTEYFYPRSEFWKIVRTYPEVLIIIGCDAHQPRSLDDEALKETIKFAEDLRLSVQPFVKIK
jgi:histidinol-phosphatase (PHP family)